MNDRRIPPCAIKNLFAEALAIPGLERDEGCIAAPFAAGSPSAASPAPAPAPAWAAAVGQETVKQVQGARWATLREVLPNTSP